MLKYFLCRITLLMAGIEKGKVDSRPFGQRDYPDIGVFKPTFAGSHYKFTLLLPVSERFVEENISKKVFVDEDIDNIKALFRTDFGGHTTYFEVQGPPPIRGEWVDPKNGKIVIDWHVRIEAYTRRHERAVEYFDELKARLLRHVRDVRHMEQEEIIIERAKVNFAHTRPLEMIIAESEERLKYLKR